MEKCTEYLFAKIFRNTYEGIFLGIRTRGINNYVNKSSNECKYRNRRNSRGNQIPGNALEHGSTAPQHTWRTTPGADSGRGNDCGLYSRNWLSASRHGEDIREPHIHAGHTLHGQFRLSLPHAVRDCSRGGSRATYGTRTTRARPVYSPAGRRDAAHRQPPGICWHLPARPRCFHPRAVGLPRPRRHDGVVRGPGGQPFYRQLPAGWWSTPRFSQGLAAYV